MTTFNPSSARTDMDFIAFTVAMMEAEGRTIDASAIALGLPPDLVGIFLSQLDYYRKHFINGAEPRTLNELSSPGEEASVSPDISREAGN